MLTTLQLRPGSPVPSVNLSLGPRQRLRPPEDMAGCCTGCSVLEHTTGFALPWLCPCTPRLVLGCFSFQVVF